MRKYISVVILLVLPVIVMAAPKARFDTVTVDNQLIVKDGRWVDVRAYIPAPLHATILACTENADLTSYIRTAIAAAQYGTLRFPPGRYRFDNVVVPTGTMIQGFGPGIGQSSEACGLKTINDNTAMFIVKSNSHGIAFCDLNIQPTTPAWSGMSNSIGILFSGTVAAGSISHVRFENCKIMNFGTAVRWNDEAYPGGSGWMIDGVLFSNTSLLGKKCFYNNAGNTTDIMFDTTACNIFGVGSIGYEIPMGGSFIWSNSWVGTPNPADRTRNGIGWKIGVGSFFNWINSAAEGPRYTIVYTGAGTTTAIEGTHLNFDNFGFGPSIFNGSANITSRGSTFCGDILFLDNAATLHWESVGDSFSRNCNSLTPYDNNLPQGGRQFVDIPSITQVYASTFRRNGTLYTGPGVYGYALTHQKSPYVIPKTLITTSYTTMADWDDGTFHGAVHVDANIWCDNTYNYSIQVGSSVDNVYSTKVMVDNAVCTAGWNTWGGVFITDSRVTHQYFKVQAKASSNNVMYFYGVKRYIPDHKDAEGTYGGDAADLNMNSNYHY